MIITNIKTNIKKNMYQLSATVQFEGEPPEELFIKVPQQYKFFVSDDASPFLAAILLPSMKRKEDIRVEGSIADEQFKTLKKIMEVVEKWQVGFTSVNIHVRSRSQEQEKPEHVGSFFTGGVDSFYTYLKHKKDITHLILIHGCDIPLRNKSFFRSVQKRINTIAKDESVNLVEVKTNMRDIIEPRLEWEWELGSALSAIALTLRKGFKKIFIPSGMNYEELCPYGTHPDFDPLWSTKTLAIIHDGCEATRLDKVMAISQSELALNNLRVCCHIIKGKYNCNTCFKCVQTKIELICANALQRAETFDKTIDLNNVKKTFYNYDLHFNTFGEQALSYLKKHHMQPELQTALEESLKKSKYPSLLRRLTDYVAYLDKTYNKRRLYSFIFSSNEKEDRTMLFKWIAKMGLVK